MSGLDDFLLGYPQDRHDYAPEQEEQEPYPGDDLDCPNCGAMLEIVAGGMLECHLCGFSDNDTAEVEE